MVRSKVSKFCIRSTNSRGTGILGEFDLKYSKNSRVPNPTPTPTPETRNFDIFPTRSSLRITALHVWKLMRDPRGDVIYYYRTGTVKSKSFVGKVLLRIKWKFKLNNTL